MWNREEEEECRESKAPCEKADDLIRLKSKKIFTSVSHYILDSKIYSLFLLFYYLLRFLHSFLSLFVLSIHLSSFFILFFYPLSTFSCCLFYLLFLPSFSQLFLSNYNISLYFKIYNFLVYLLNFLSSPLILTPHNSII